MSLNQWTRKCRRVNESYQGDAGLEVSAPDGVRRNFWCQGSGSMPGPTNREPPPTCGETQVTTLRRADQVAATSLKIESR